jgi:FtsP/CotA-like multicopper oxidase with cupredoxin domain
MRMWGRAWLAIAGLCTVVGLQAQSTELKQPPVFTSINGALSLTMVAKPLPIGLGEYQPTAWVYEVCPRVLGVDSCPAGTAAVAPYGGVRLQLSPGDHLRIHLVNQLPPAPADATYAQEMPAMLGPNPTNLHTHGLITEPRRAGNGDNTYGDYVYVYGYPAGQLPTMMHPGLDYTDQPIDYDIAVPANHPSGLFWFHPHVHGLSLNQVSSGLAGVITIGALSDYVDLGGNSSGSSVRYLTLKDMQVEKDNMVDDEEDPAFCAPDPQKGEGPRNGSCPGLPKQDPEMENHAGGRWFFTVNGQVYPTITLPKGSGEIWRFTNTSGSRAYAISLLDDKTGKALPFQLLSIDGVSIDIASGGAGTLGKFGGKVVPSACGGGGGGKSAAVCASKIYIVPAGRMEVWVKSTGKSASATLVTTALLTGTDGDEWPAVNLAHVVFPTAKGKGNAPVTVAVHGQAGKLMRKSGVLGAAIDVKSEKPKTIAPRPAQIHDVVAATEQSAVTCNELSPGHRRRIFFGVPASNPDAFGLGYEELDAQGIPVPGTFRDIEPFDHTTVSVCLPLAAGNVAAVEQWELVNVAAEDHDFHIHQTKFLVLPQDAPRGDANVLMDTVLLKSGSTHCDGTIETWRQGGCAVKPVAVQIPFAEVGDFVYHCHILEHEDGGMMAHIRVVPAK